MPLTGRVRSLLEYLFMKCQVFTINRIGNCFTLKEQHLKNSEANKNLFKTDENKDNKTVSIDVIRFSL